MHMHSQLLNIFGNLNHVIEISKYVLVHDKIFTTLLHSHLDGPEAHLPSEIAFFDQKRHTPA